MMGEGLFHLVFILKCFLKMLLLLLIQFCLLDKVLTIIILRKAASKSNVALTVLF